jgi:hypothetical protein
MPFVGRRAELRVLDDAWTEALDGSASVVLVSGEAGSGKSRLLDAFLTSRCPDATVWTGRAWESGGTPPFWLWREAMATTAPAEESAAPGLAEPAGSEAARFRFFEDVAEGLRRAAERQPVLLWLDDVHAADEPSQVLLRFVARSVRVARLMIVVTYRANELDTVHGAELLADLARGPVARSIVLDGLTRADVVELAAGSGLAATDEAMAGLHRDTAGNPLFVGELLRMLTAGGGEVGQRPRSMTPTVRAVIAQRLARLPPACAEVLEIAAVIGRDFDVRTVAAVIGRTVPGVLDDVAVAVADGIVTQDDGSGGLRFSHALVQSVLYDSMVPSRRIEVHRAVGEALARHDGDHAARVMQVAHHLLAAAPGGAADQAVGAARRAGDVALRTYGYEDAERLYTAALRVAETYGSGDAALRCDLRLGVGDSQACSGRLLESKATFLDAAARAQEAQLPAHLARAALGYGGRWIWGRAGNDPNLVRLLEDALRAIGPDDSAARVLLLARLACARRSDPDRDAVAQLAEDAVSMAERVGDEAALAYAYDAQLGAVYWYDNPARRLELVAQRAPAIHRHGDQERTLNLLLGQLSAHIELGDLAGARVALQRMRVLADGVRLPAYQWMVASIMAMLELMRGEVAQAVVLMEAEEALGRSITSEADVALRVHRIALAMLTGDDDGLAEEIRAGMDAAPWHPLFRCLLAEHHLHTGDVVAARSVAAELAAADFRSLLPKDNEWLLCASVMADVCAEVGEASSVRWLHDELLPIAGLNVVGISELCRGAASRSLGVLAAALGRDEEAEAHFAHSIEMNAAMGAQTWALRSRIDRARMLARRGDVRTAAVELDEVVADAARLGLHGLVRLAERASATTSEAAAPAPIPAEAVFRRDGDVWRIAFEGDAFHLASTRGLVFLAGLLRRPGEDLPALELTSPGDSALLAQAEPGMPMIDAAAQRAYRRRVIDLIEEVDEATRWNDPERRERARQELELIEDELSRTTGLGGRTREVGAAAERARVNVTRAIKSAVERIEAHSPHLGAHLRATIRTGTFCSYRPDPRVPVRWDV